MMKDSPNVRIDVLVTRIPEFAGLLKRREVDIVVGEVTAFEGEAGVEVFPLRPQQVVFFCRADHPLARRRKVDAKSFFSYPHVATELPPAIDRWLDQQRPAGAPTQGFSLVCSHYALLQRVVEESDAISGAQLSVVRPCIRAGRLGVVRFAENQIQSPVGVAYLKTRQPTPMAKRLIDELRMVADES
jgi:DNA-binding transcriptional LysR family regulator